MMRWMIEINELLDIAFNVDILDNPRRFRVDRQLVPYQSLVRVRAGV
jgi:AMMECR1 domain-containing protein